MQIFLPYEIRLIACPKQTLFVVRAYRNEIRSTGTVVKIFQTISFSHRQFFFHIDSTIHRKFGFSANYIFIIAHPAWLVNFGFTNKDKCDIIITTNKKPRIIALYDTDKYEITQR